MVLAHSVEAHGFGQLRIPPDRLAVGRRKYTVRIVALVQYQLHIIGAVVETDPAILHRNLPHAKIAVYPVQQHIIRPQGHLYIV
ncbi:hypothetical protein D3C75_1091110 [compost metagenome]